LILHAKAGFGDFRPRRKDKFGFLPASTELRLAVEPGPVNRFPPEKEAGFLSFASFISRFHIILISLPESPLLL
jgi:hypothetical protein